MHTLEGQVSAFQVIREQLTAAIEATKCHGCGCFQQTVAALTPLGQADIAPLLRAARAVFQPKHYECLGCPVCYPAIAANAFTEAPPERQGWPPLPGDYHVLKYRAPVAVCTLHSAALADRLKHRAPDGLAIVGTLHTENLGIERLIKNTLANPHVRFLLVCGDETRQAIGHLSGQTLQSLVVHGVDACGRIREARGKRPVLKNVTPAEIQAFREQVTLVPLLGKTCDDVIDGQVESYRRRGPGPYAGAPQSMSIPVVQAAAPERVTLDPAGYFVL